MGHETILNWLTAFLGAATVWLAIETRRMAKTTKTSVEVELQPAFSVTGLHITMGAVVGVSTGNLGRTRLGLIVRNPGKVRIRYHLDDMAASIGGFNDVAGATLGNRAGVLHPDEELTIFYPLIVSPAQVGFPIDGEIAFRISYWVDNTDKFTCRGTIEFNTTSAERHEWRWREGPSYSP